jgi:hypothetical protein
MAADLRKEFGMEAFPKKCWRVKEIAERML